MHCWYKPDYCPSLLLNILAYNFEWRQNYMLKHIAEIKDCNIVYITSALSYFCIWQNLLKIHHPHHHPWIRSFDLFQHRCVALKFMEKKRISKLWAVCLQNGVSFVQTNEQTLNNLGIMVHIHEYFTSVCPANIM
jgi:hypothetical protein